MRFVSKVTEFMPNEEQWYDIGHKSTQCDHVSTAEKRGA